MKTPKRGLWRPLRYLLLIATAGVVIAADNSWMTKLRFDFTDPANWLSSFYSTEPAPEAPAVVEQAATAAPTLNMDGLLNGYLFSKPSTASWQLDSSKSAGPILKAASGPIVQVNGNSLPTAVFSALLAELPASIGPVPGATTANGIWNSNASGNWGNSANWTGGVIADGAGGIAHFDALNTTTNVTVSLDTSRTIGELYLGDTNGTHQYTIAPVSGTTLTFDSGAQFQNAILQQSTSSGGDTVAANILLKSDLDINNLSSSNPFEITGNISSNAGVSSFNNVWFNRTAGTGAINVSGNISDGNGSIGVVVVDGTVTFTGTNTYSGNTSVDGGTLLINGNNSGATDSVFVSSGGTLGGTGTIGGDVHTFGGAITGADSTSVGTLTLLGDLRLRNGEVDGIYLANLSGSFSDLLAISGTMFMGGDSELHIVGAADGVTTYTLATFSARDGMFDPTLVSGIPANYALVYHDTDLQLVPIPEPATWIGGTLALGAIAFAARKRKKLKS